MLYQETPSGSVNGSNSIFGLTYVPVANSLQLFVNGLLQREGTHYSVVDNTINMVEAPDAGWWLTACYTTSETSATGALVSQLGDIAQWVAVDILNRSDLLPQAIKFAKEVYNLICTKVPFDELQTTSAERPMTVGTATYDISDLDIAGIVSVRLTVSSNSYIRLKRSHVRKHDGMSSVTNNIPRAYARWGRTIEVFPPPMSASYTYRLRYWRRPSFTATIEDTAILTPSEWDELYKWETLYKMYYALERYSEASSLVMSTGMPRQAEPKKRTVHEIGIIPRLWNDLLQTVSQRENVDEDFSINPIVRPYTHGHA